MQIVVHVTVIMSLIFICDSSKLLLGHRALVWLVGFKVVGSMLSGSGMRVFVLGNLRLGWSGWEKYRSVLGRVGDAIGVGCRGGQGWWRCIVYGRYLKDAVVRSVSCNAHYLKTT